jgi:hypothetical protein
MTEPAEYLLVTAAVGLPLVFAVILLGRMLLRYYSVGVGVIDLPCF